MDLTPNSPQIWIPMAILHFTGLAVALRALGQSRPPQSTTAWILGLLFCPILTLPFYAVFGRNRVQGYVRARRSRDRAIVSATRPIIRKLGFWRTSPSSHLKFFQALEKIAVQGFTRGNHVDLLIDGHQTFETLFSAIHEAKNYILVEFFIVENDRVGDRFHNLLCQKAREGVKVWLIFDDIGSHKLNIKYLHTLRKAGVTVLPFGGKRGRLINLFHVNFRNHRKLVITDGNRAFLGGVNIGADYLGDGPLGVWRDTFIGLQGPCVLAAQLVFTEDWHWASQGQILPVESPDPTPYDHGEPVMILPTGPADPYPSWRMAVICAANAARHRIWIASPYFVPDDGVLAALTAAALRGVDVRILLPDKSDHLAVYLASFTYYPETIPYGVKIYRYRRGFLHQKVVLVDDWTAMIGTANLDNRSLVLNFEIMGVMNGEKTIHKVASMLTTDFSHAREARLDDYTRRSFAFRTACQACRLIAPVL